MNILILNWRDITHPKSGGAEIVTMEHAKAWVEAGHRVTWFTSWYQGAPHMEIVDGVEIIRKAGSLKVYLAAPFFLLRNSRKYDVIVDEIHGLPFFSPMFTRKPVIVFIHEIAGEIWDYMYPFPVNLIGKILEHLYFRLYRGHRFWTDAPSMIDELVARGIPKKDCTAIPCPIRLPPIRKFTKAGIPTYIFVSRVVKMKGIEEVIKAFAFIRKEQYKARLWIVGGGDPGYISILKAMIADYGVGGSVVFWGKVSEREKFELLSQAHILLHASVKEGWGLVVLEAASTLTPSVVYNVPGLRDVVKNGETGVVIEHNSPQKLAREAVRLYNDNRRYEQYRKQGLEWVRSLTWEDVTRQSLSLIEEAIPPTRVPAVAVKTVRREA